MQFLEDFAIAIFDGLTNTFDSLHEKLRARRAKKRARDKGGHLKPGLNKMLNSTRIIEPVLDKGQWHVVANVRHEAIEKFVEQLDQENRKKARMAAEPEPLNLAKALQDSRKELADTKQKLAEAEAEIARLKNQQR